MVEDGFIVNGAYSFDVLPSHQTHFMKDVRLFYCYVELFGGGRKHLISICTCIDSMIATHPSLENPTIKIC